MKVSQWILVTLCLACSRDLLLGQTAQTEKVAEGQYARMKDGKPVLGSMQFWVLSRVPHGYVLEDHFQLQPDLVPQILTGVGSKPLSP